MNNSRTIKVLRAAKGFIEKGWCKGELAVDAKGVSVPPRSKQAVRWCAIGALDAVTKNNNAAWDALSLALPAYGSASVIHFNNTARSKRDVLRLFDRAIETLGQRQDTKSALRRSTQ